MTDSPNPPLPAGVELIDETVRVARLVAAGEQGHTDRLAALGQALSQQTNHYRRRGGRRRRSTYGDMPSPAIRMMRETADGPLVRTAGHVRAVLAGRGMTPYEHLRSMALETLPRWPLPDDDTADVVVYRASYPGAGSLWNAVADHDEPRIARLNARLAEDMHGPPDYDLNLRD